MEITARLTADAQVNILKDGRRVVSFNVAINDRYKAADSGEVTKVTTYVQCSYWINANIAKHLTKGTLVELYGRIGVNAYTNLQGEPKASLTFHVNSIKLHGKSRTKEKQSNTTAPVSANEITEPLEDLPF